MAEDPHDQPDHGSSGAPGAHSNAACASSWFWGRFSGVGLVTAFLTTLIDQIHKFWMLNVFGIKSGDRIQVFPFFDLVYVKNTGISYSMFDWDSMQWQWILAGFACVVSVCLWVWLSKTGRTLLFAVSLGLIIGGAMGNAIDRAVLGGVADFFLLHAFDRSWYVFNVADIAIVAGVAGLLYESFVLSRNDAAKTS